MKQIFVFGSNLGGMHGAGSALAAMKEHGAVYGLGVGPSGNSYAIPTKDANLEVLPLEIIKLYVDQFLDYAYEIFKMKDLWDYKANIEDAVIGDIEENPYDVEFNIVPIGCGLAGYTFDQIAPMFRRCPDNCIFTNGDFAAIVYAEEVVNHCGQDTTITEAFGNE